MAFPISCGLSERITFKVSNCARRGSFCLHSQSKQQECQTQVWLHLCLLPDQLRASSDVKQALSSVTLQGHKNSLWGAGLMQLLGVSPLVSQSTKTVRLIDGAYFILSLKIRKVKDLRCSLVILSSWGFVQCVLFSLCSSLWICHLCLFWMHEICFNMVAFASFVSPMHLFKLL